MLTDAERAFIKGLHERVDRLEAAGKYEKAELIIEKNRAVFTLYTVRDGVVHYCGHVANENGWTP